jgi:hypothetical protein
MESVSTKASLMGSVSTKAILAASPGAVQPPIWCRPKEGARLAGCGIVKFYELLHSGLVESRKVDGMRLCRVSSIEKLGEKPDTPAAA